MEYELDNKEKYEIYRDFSKKNPKIFNENMEEFEMEAEGLLARCILHENDHLDGIVYVDKVEGKLYDNSELYPEEEQ